MSERILIEEGENLEPQIDAAEEADIVRDIRRDQRSDPTAHLDDLMDELYGDRNQSRSHDEPAPPTMAEIDATERAKHEFLRALVDACNNELRSAGLGATESKFTPTGFAVAFVDRFSFMYAIELSYENANKLAERTDRAKFQLIVGAICREAIAARDRRIPIVGRT